jgi:ubiquitin C-terminal hydrolase
MEPKGIVNLGNTCYINVCIQILYHTAEFTDIICSANPDKSNEKYPIFQQWKEIQDIMCDSPPFSRIIPKLFMNHMAEYTKNGGEPQDSSEFLELFLDAFHVLLKRDVSSSYQDSCKWICEYLKEYSEIAELFYGAYYSKIISASNGNVLSTKPEMFFMLDLPVQTYTNPVRYYHSVDECIEELLRPERLEGENAWYNEDTRKKEPIDKQICIWKFPTIFILLFKRFSLDGTKTKDTLITFPQEGFRLNQYECSPEYDLYGVWNHYGNTDGGHYTAMVKNSKEEWYHYNDHLIEKIDPSKIMTEYAYCLFYRKRK